jgi:uncharacterized membrane protein YfcA
MISASDVLVLLLAGVLAGTVGSAGAIASLVSYPVLLAVGLPALSANVTNIIAVAACWPGSALASRPELRGRGPWVRRHALVAVVGAIVGTTLLLSTSAGVFRDVVPFLVAGGSLTLLFQPQMTARRSHHRGRAGGLALAWTLVLVAAYNGYFGAGSGVMTLALLLVMVEPNMQTANALKNMLLGAATTVSAVGLMIFGPVDWRAVAPLAVGMFVGSTIGPRVARRLPANVLRLLVVLLGLGLAVDLWVGSGS